MNHPRPSDWRRFTLENVADIASGITLGRPLRSRPSRRVPYLRVANVKDGWLDLGDVYEVDATQDEIEKCRLRFGDILLTEGGDPDKLGRGTFWAEQIPECIHQNHIFRVRLPAEEFCHDFVSLQFASPYGKAYFLAHAKQTTGIACINRTVLGRFPLMAPPVFEQRRIAARLRAQLDAAAKARAAVQTQLESARKLPAALLRTQFAGQWPSRQLGEVAEIVGGIQKTPDRAPRTFCKPFLTVRNVQRGYLDLTHVEQFELRPEEFERNRLHPGDILIVEGNGSAAHIGRNALFDQTGDWIHQNHIIRVRLPDNKFCPAFVSFFLNSDAGRRQMLEKAQTTTGLYTLSTSKVAALQVPSPSLLKQNSTVQRLQQEVREANALQATLTNRLSALDRLPAALLREAFSGRV